MCGIVGYVNLSHALGVQPKLERYLTNALIVDTLRGWDSTGVAFIKKNGEVDQYKRALSGTDFVFLRKYNKLVKNTNAPLAVIGHNRSATSGKVTDQNSHPFKVNHITLVHNGTLDLWEAGTGAPLNKFDVDSQEIAWALATKDTKQVLESLNGAFALVWYNSKDNTINFARNDKRPFCIASTESDEQLFFASTEEIIKCALADPISGGCTFPSLKKYHTLGSGLWCSIKLEQGKLLSKQTKITKFTPYVPPVKELNYTTYRHPILSKYHILADTRILFRGIDVQTYNTGGGFTFHGEFCSNGGDSKNYKINIMSYGTSVKDLEWDMDHGNDLIYSGEVNTAHVDQATKKDCIRVVNVKIEGTEEEFERGELDYIDTNFFVLEDDEGDAENCVKVPGGYISEKEYQKIISDGCSFCGANLVGIPAEQMAWFNEETNSPLCESCDTFMLGEEENSNATAS